MGKRTYSLSRVQKEHVNIFKGVLGFSSDHKHVKACTEPNMAKDKSYNAILARSIKSSLDNIKQPANV